MEILTPFSGEVLVLAMLFVLNIRIFFTRRTRIDALSLLAPFSLFVIILEMLAWGLRFSNLAIFALSLACTILNYRNMVRFSQQLFVDSYSIKFFVGSVIFLIITVLAILVTLYTRPVRLNTKRYGVEVSRKYYSYPTSGELSEFKEAAEISDHRNLTLYKFSNKNSAQEKDKLILFVPDVEAECLQYEPYFILLARKGYTVLAADLYDYDFKNFSDFSGTKFLRRFLLVLKEFYARDSSLFREQRNIGARAHRFYSVYERTYKALAKIAHDDFPEKDIYIISDSSAFFPKKKIESIFAGIFTSSESGSRAAPDVLNLQKIPAYTTPGLGFIAQTSPLFSYIVLGKPRDKTCFEPSYCVTLTEQRIK